MLRRLVFFLFTGTNAFALGPWIQKQSLTGLGRHLACSMTIGQCGYVGGGWDGVSTYNDFWEYDPATNAWTQKANTPALMWNVPCFGIDTAGYFCFPGSTWMFRPTANTWTNVNPSAPANTYLEERKWVINGKGYVTDQANIFCFDPQTFQWSTVFTLPSNGFAPDVGFAIGNKAYLLDNYYLKFYEYDPVANTLTQKASSPLPNTYGIGFSVNGKGYCGLGFVNNQVGSTKKMVEYDPVTNSWRFITQLEGSDRRKATSFVIGNRGYITCGSSGINLNDLWEFDANKATDVNEAEEETVLSVYPNPCTGHLYVRLNSLREPQADIIDVNGKLVKHLPLVTGLNQVDLSSEKNGVYFLKVRNSVKKIVVEK